MTIDVKKYTNHESYDFRSQDNDITIIELAKEVDLSIYTPACLARSEDTTAFDGRDAWVYGEIIFSLTLTDNWSQVGVI